MKITKIIAILLIAILVLSAVSMIDFGGETPNENNNTIVNRPSDTPEEPSEPEEPIVNDRIELFSADFLALNQKHNFSDNSGLIRMVSQFTDFKHSANKDSMEANYGEKTKYSDNNYYQIDLPNYEEGIYSFEYAIDYYGNDMPVLINYVKSPNVSNSVTTDKFSSDTTHTLEYNSDIGHTIHYVLSFDFNKNVLYHKTSDETGAYEFNVYDISGLKAYDGNGELLLINYRTCISAKKDIVDLTKIAIRDVKYIKHVDGSSIVPDDFVPEEDTDIIEGDYRVLSSGQELYMIEHGNTTSNIHPLDDGEEIRTSVNLSDYAVRFEEGVGVWESKFDYIGPDSGKYGTNAFSIHLPNYESGTYVFSVDLICNGETDFFYPTALWFFLTSNSYLNINGLLDFDTTKVAGAELLGYEFKTNTGGRFKLELVMNFDEDIAYLNLVDLNGKSISTEPVSLADYREWVNPSTGETINTKDYPIVFRMKTKDNTDVNPNNTSVEFGAWSFKKLIENA